MDFLKVRFAQFQKYLSGLSPSQKMLTVALLAIMLMTAGWWWRYAGTAEMEPVLDQELASEDLSRMKSAIAAKGIPYQVSGSRLLVPVDRKFEILADLGYSQLLPSNTQGGVDEIIQKINPWSSQATNEVMFTKMKEATLAQVIRGFPRVRQAVVVLDTTSRRSFSNDSFLPSASINITMRQGEKADKKLINAAADFVAGATANLQRGRVKVVVDGVSYTVQDNDPEFGGGGEWMDRVKECERYYSGKIMDHLASIDGVMVSVTVQPNMDAKEIQEEKFDKAGVVKTEKRIDHTSDDTRTDNRTASGGEPGMGTNVRADLTNPASGSGGSGETSTTNRETEKTEMEAFVPRTLSKTRSPGGSVQVLAATVRVPRSYFVRIWKQAYPDQGEPKENVLKSIEDMEMPKIRAAVKGCTNLAEDAVMVSDYADFTPLAVAAPQAASAPLSLALSGHVKEIALGILAVISLFMVSMMVKRSAPPAPVDRDEADDTLVVGSTLPKGEVKPSTPKLVVDDLAGEVAEGHASLDGIEMDPEAVRTQQVAEQVATLVKENPEAAATLVKRWMSRT